LISLHQTDGVGDEAAGFVQGNRMNDILMAISPFAPPRRG